MATHWKPASAFAYTLICFCDFVIFPSYSGLNKVDLIVLIDHIKDLDISVQAQLIRAASDGYEPFTLRGSGLFHLSFGALLTGAAIAKNTTGVTYSERGAKYQRRAEDFDKDEKDDQSNKSS